MSDRAIKDRAIMDIERALDSDRVALAQSLAALRSRLRPSALVEDGKAAVVARVLGWWPAPSGAKVATDDPALAGTRFEALSRWEDEGGPPAPASDGPEPVVPEAPWLTEAQGLMARARALMARIDDAARRGLAPAADLARHRAEVIAALAADTRLALGRGLEALDTAAQDQAILARERIVAGWIETTDKGRAQVAARPLMAGALVALSGAMLGFLLPPTDTEDRFLGDARDRLARDTKRLARREAVQASDLARTLAAALKSDVGRAGSIFAPAANAARRARRS